MSTLFANVDPLVVSGGFAGMISQDHLVHFIFEVMVMVLLYCYTTGLMSSRKIETATYTDVAVRYLCGNKAHPDHSGVFRFRTGNRKRFREIRIPF
jgi:hypothetical protein